MKEISSLGHKQWLIFHVQDNTTLLINRAYLSVTKQVSIVILNSLVKYLQIGNSPRVDLSPRRFGSCTELRCQGEGGLRRRSCRPQW
jgi:hypothetical protein